VFLKRRRRSLRDTAATTTSGQPLFVRVPLARSRLYRLHAASISLGAGRGDNRGLSLPARRRIARGEDTRIQRGAALPCRLPGTGALVEVLANLSKIRNVSLKSPFSGHQSLFEVFLYI
jgi:hypothetical protein